MTWRREKELHEISWRVPERIELCKIEDPQGGLGMVLAKTMMEVMDSEGLARS